MHVNLRLIYNDSQVLRIFHLDARFYTLQQNRICYCFAGYEIEIKS